LIGITTFTTHAAVGIGIDIGIEIGICVCVFTFTLKFKQKERVFVQLICVFCLPVFQFTRISSHGNCLVQITLGVFFLYRQTWKYTNL